MVKLLKGTLLSALIFFSISFITVLLQLNSPLHRQVDASLSIGFPFTFYKQFLIDPPIINSGWFVGKLLLDCLITWVIVTGVYVRVKRSK